MKNANRTSILVVTSFAFAAGLIGCGRGGHTPAGYSKENTAQHRCKATTAFNAAKIEAINADRNAVMKSLAASGTGPLQVRTYITSDTTQGTRAVGSPTSVARTASERSAIDQRDNNDVTVLINCESLAATYSGPGSDTAVTGKLDSVTGSSMVIKGKDANGNSVNVTVASKPSKEANQTQALNNGFAALEITVETTVLAQAATAAASATSNQTTSKVLAPAPTITKRTQKFTQDVALIKASGKISVHVSALTDVLPVGDITTLATSDTQKVVFTAKTAMDLPATQRTSKTQTISLSYEQLKELQALALKRATGIDDASAAAAAAKTAAEAAAKIAADAAAKTAADAAAKIAADAAAKTAADAAAKIAADAAAKATAETARVAANKAAGLPTFEISPLTSQVPTSLSAGTSNALEAAAAQTYKLNLLPSTFTTFNVPNQQPAVLTAFDLKIQPLQLSSVNLSKPPEQNATQGSPNSK